MVKGVSKRIVVVQPSDTAIFEQAIFIIKDQTKKSNDIIDEAFKIAKQYSGDNNTKKYIRKRWTNKHLFLAAFLGASSVSIIWLISNILPISIF